MAANKAIEYAPQCGDLTVESLVFQTNNVVGNFNYPQNCTTNAYDPNPPADETQSRPIKEYLVKFSVMNGKKPLTLDFRTFTTSTGLKYNNGEYVAHPSPEAIEVIGSRQNKDKTSSEVESGTEILQLTTFADVQALLLSDDEMVQESDEDDVLKGQRRNDEDIFPTHDEEVILHTKQETS
ncbi:hypothetical protein Tco_0675181 [Tanacetum coccineum]